MGAEAETSLSNHALANGYLEARLLESGEVAGLMPMLFTMALCVGIDRSGMYRTRFCFHDFKTAHAALVGWDGYGRPPIEAIAQKGMDNRLIERDTI